MSDECPFCGGESKSDGVESTLVGWLGGEDPNHHKDYRHCVACGKRWVVHWRLSDGPHKAVLDEQWRVLSGVPPKCCAVLYALRCASCGGWARHVAHGRGGIWYEGGKPQQDMFYRCETCLAEMPDPQWGMYRFAPQAP